MLVVSNYYKWNDGMGNGLNCAACEKKNAQLDSGQCHTDLQIKYVMNDSICILLKQYFGLPGWGNRMSCMIFSMSFTTRDFNFEIWLAWATLLQIFLLNQA